MRWGIQAAALSELAAADTRFQAALDSAAGAECLHDLDACLEVALPQLVPIMLCHQVLDRLLQGGRE